MSKKVVTSWQRSGKPGVAGKPLVDAIGFNGNGCDKATAGLRDMLGKDEDLTDKPERTEEAFESEDEAEGETE